jgi:hypothetical protein
VRSSRATAPHADCCRTLCPFGLFHLRQQLTDFALGANTDVTAASVPRFKPARGLIVCYAKIRSVVVSGDRTTGAPRPPGFPRNDAVGTSDRVPAGLGWSPALAALSAMLKGPPPPAPPNKRSDATTNYSSRSAPIRDARLQINRTSAFQGEAGLVLIAKSCKRSNICGTGRCWSVAGCEREPKAMPIPNPNHLGRKSPSEFRL